LTNRDTSFNGGIDGLNVPYSEKEAAKALGARWDSIRETWYVSPGVDINLFSRWDPEIAKWNRLADGNTKRHKRR
jgi:hypothetical protein